MGRKKGLTAEEKAIILVLNGQGMSKKAIAEFVARSRDCVSKFLQDPDAYGSRYVTGRPKALSVRDENHLLRKASEGKENSKQLLKYVSTPVHDSTIRRYLRKSQLFVYQKRKKTPKLTEEHKKKRVQWAEEKVDYGSKWDEVIFSDEKKFNLDGPDGCQFYWHDLRKEEENFFSRQMGGQSVMVWAGFSAKGKTKIAFLEGKQDSRKYIDTLWNYLLPFAMEKHGSSFEFQQDNAAIHTSSLTKSFLSAGNVKTMQWPALSPDLNPIENLWGILVHRVYAGGAQYEDLTSLKNKIEVEWEKLGENELKPLIKSMKSRCIAVIKGKGAKTKY